MFSPGAMRSSFGPQLEKADLPVQYVKEVPRLPAWAFQRLGRSPIDPTDTTLGSDAGHQTVLCLPGLVAKESLPLLPADATSSIPLLYALTIAPSKTGLRRGSLQELMPAKASDMLTMLTPRARAWSRPAAMEQSVIIGLAKPALLFRYCTFIE